MRELSGQTAIVTGAGAAGIGRGIALTLAAAGAGVLVVDLDGDRATETTAAIRELGGTAIPVDADVSRATDVERSVQEAVDWAGRVDILASNVGIYPTSTFESISEEQWDRVMAVNLKSAFLMLRAVLPVMRRQQYGRIVITSSITGPRTGVPGLAHYAASKAGLMGLVRSVALEVASDGITVNAVLPGNIETEGARAEGGQEYFDAMRPTIPVGRLGTPEDIGWAVRTLAAPQASFITGTGLVVDGGQSVPEGGLTAERIETVFGIAS